MKVFLELVLDIEGSILKKYNTIHCWEDDLPKRVHDWMTEIIWETGFRQTSFVRAMVIEERDISAEVEVIRKNPFSV
ncbi:hypothetical protein FZC83_15745 [Rossellomorea marisflavi]|uniref:Uncharacterized protein n=1 Tax=Rossellomorea marisflavi TaxID=189381 RepID=A0A5D4RU71_9BACI|nr:hypothetical protein FZC83_15745 [Rossellomorea marisflavi]